ncbi:MAG: trehalase family glycosidase [Bacteroidetes bacterium]|nr:trehalase family glycosidase [Bacteroidota bacterium]
MSLFNLFSLQHLFKPILSGLLLLGSAASAQTNAEYPPPGKLRADSPVYLSALKRWALLEGKSAHTNDTDLIPVNSLAAKCIFTLLNNRQGPAGGLKHEGVYPSYKDFAGFWAWDSWKQAYALASIAPELAKNNIRAMFDYQDSSGMVADCIFIDSTENNYRDTKPPLAAWAVAEIFRQTSDTCFVREMFTKLLKYHRWWYKNRDHDHNGLCEYGSTDGTLQAARWESGWDNAVRFDSARMVQNNSHAWSMDQESADLNSYLFVEKHCLSFLALVLGQAALAETLDEESFTLGKLIRTMMWDDRSGFFYDIGLVTKKPILVAEPNGWLPLWAGIATKEQARRIRNLIMSKEEFNTFVPFPTVAADNQGFNPEKGYWRGPVWLDQAYFAIRGLLKYGYRDDAVLLMNKLFRNCEGLSDPARPIRENYHPLTGKGMNAENFSRSSAHVLMMISEVNPHHK